ncbi:MAG: CsbD family protein [Abditibacteriaceae bacterium]
MSSTKDKVRGSVNDAVGDVKKKVGKATGDQKMKNEGAGQQVKGKAQKALGNAKDAVSNAADSVSKVIKKSGD